GCVQQRWSRSCERQQLQECRLPVLQVLNRSRDVNICAVRRANDAQKFAKLLPECNRNCARLQLPLLEVLCQSLPTFSCSLRFLPATLCFLIPIGCYES